MCGEPLRVGILGSETQRRLRALTIGVLAACGPVAPAILIINGFDFEKLKEGGPFVGLVLLIPTAIALIAALGVARREGRMGARRRTQADGKLKERPRMGKEQFMPEESKQIGTAEIKITATADGACTIKIGGEVDMSTYEQLLLFLRRKCSQYGAIVFDLSELAYTDSSGVRLIGFAAADKGIENVAVFGVNESVRRILHLVMDRHLTELESPRERDTWLDSHKTAA